MAEAEAEAGGRSDPVPRAPAPTAPTAPLARKHSHQERINDILETGQKRAASFGRRISGPESPRLQPLLAPPVVSVPPETAREDGSRDEHDDDDDDGVAMRPATKQRSMNYHSTAEQSSAQPRRSESALSQKSLDRYRPTQQAAAAAAVTAAGGVGPGASGGDVGPRLPRSDQKRDVGRKDKGRWKTALGKFQSLELENTASVARDHLALERTFLAWLRTSLGFASMGIAVTQLFRLNTSLAGNAQGDALRRVGKPLGATFLVISILVLLLGYNRFLTGQRWLVLGKFPASRGTILFVSLIAFSVMAASLIVILAVSNGLQ